MAGNNINARPVANMNAIAKSRIDIFGSSSFTFLLVVEYPLPSLSYCLLSFIISRPSFSQSLGLHNLRHPNAL